jgi:hydroxyethylthiazole kinase-like sugar kinase family protein
MRQRTCNIHQLLASGKLTACKFHCSQISLDNKKSKSKKVDTWQEKSGMSAKSEHAAQKIAEIDVLRCPIKRVEITVCLGNNHQKNNLLRNIFPSGDCVGYAYCL